MIELVLYLKKQGRNSNYVSMKPSLILRKTMAGACLLLAACPLAFGQLTSSIGTRHFNDGDSIGTGTYITAVSGQSTPFGQFNGSDASGPNFSTQWAMFFSPPASVASVGSASLTFGFYDHDSAASLTPVSMFTAGGVDLTSTLNAIVTAHGGANQEYNVYTINLPASAFPSLLGGAIEFELALNGPGMSVLGETTFNGAGLDFAEFYIAVPEPATEAWVGVGAAMALIGAHFHRRRSR